MNGLVRYIIDGHKYAVDCQNGPAVSFGKKELLSRQDTDVTYGLEWYKHGFNVYPLLSDREFEAIKVGVSDCVANILEHIGIVKDGFDLEKYHRYVRDDSTHFQVVGRTRDLFPEDFNISTEEIVEKLENCVGFGLSDFDMKANYKLHIIVRINRPGSKDFNPVHKDIYEAWDQSGYLPKMMNFWLPIAGVTARSSLPVAPGSHLFDESKILRTTDGAFVEGNHYRVRNVISWNGENTLSRAVVSEGQVLAFSSYLIHGLAFNEEPDKTRVALEFRLFKKEI